MAETTLALFGASKGDVVFLPGEGKEAPDRLTFTLPASDPETFADEDLLLSVLGAALRKRVLRSADGGGVAPVSVSCELTAPPAAGTALTIETRIDRRTRTIAFVSAEARSNEGEICAAATGVFRIIA